MYPLFLLPTGSQTLMVSWLLSGVWGSCEAPLSYTQCYLQASSHLVELIYRALTRYKVLCSGPGDSHQNLLPSGGGGTIAPLPDEVEALLCHLLGTPGCLELPEPRSWFPKCGLGRRQQQHHLIAISSTTEAASLSWLLPGRTPAVPEVPGPRLPPGLSSQDSQPRHPGQATWGHGFSLRKN